jgi:hypothetical protein
MMGPRQVDQASLFYEFSLERHVPASHSLRSIDRFVDRPLPASWRRRAADALLRARHLYRCRGPRAHFILTTFSRC